MTAKSFEGYATRVLQTMKRKNITFTALSDMTKISEDDLLQHLQLDTCIKITISEIWKVAEALRVDVLWLMLGELCR